MKYYKSPINKIIKTKTHGYLLLVGKNGAIYKVSKSFALLYKLGLFIFLNTKDLIRGGVLLEQPFNKFLLNIKLKSIKMISHQIPGIWILPTMNCNLKCPYCFVKPYLTNKIITKEIINKIIIFIKSRGEQYNIDWFGGEPTLYPEILEYFYDTAKKNNLKAVNSNLITNGVFKNDSIWKIIEKNITQIQITLDGIKEFHNQRRIYKNGAGTFDEIISNLDRIYKEILQGDIQTNLTVVVRCNIDRNNKESFKDFRDYIVDRYNYMFIIQDAPVKHCGIKEYDSTVMTNIEFTNLKYELYEKYGIITNSYLPSNAISFKHCGMNGIDSYSFDPDGNIYKCYLDYGDNTKIVGNCNKILVPKTCHELNYLTSGTDLLPNKCKACPLLLFCMGGCPHSRFSKNESDYCFYSKSNIGKMAEIEYEIRTAKNHNKDLVINL